ncbi:probable dolichyl-diphosphooligosaccharide--protein glycosyltransferase subunit 3B [Manihot esculenta]|uniref:Uncharacterized protein n=2 Tax=Manihot esculenta TaxID=3983 RepID=A0ACB7G285_MANES|nr:probable dolichyl-diphosphooligosaccharide--protein glycosyltransferase subunit 3B [Manihot esculenta]KAG8634384.1 hypothetical protein MANES_17G035900v8 [Manihot esculenta]KAG8634385.1 hypothetical protein MANES_17G035900v8 [Manihot esculenta]
MKPNNCSPPRKMALSPNTTTCLLLLATLLSFFVSLTTSASDPEELVNELLSLQSQSKTGVIHLDDNSISRFLTSTKTPRPYSLLIFFDATHLHDKHELRLQYLHDEFSLVASSFILNNPDKSSASYAKLFFCDVEFKESESSFSLFGVDAVPNIRLVGPNVKNPKDSDEVEQGDVPGTAELMSDFVESSIKVSVGPIHRPPFLSTKQLGLLFVVFSIWTPFMVKKVLTGQTLLHDPKIWLGGALFVYFFSVSGSMHNIIRKIPMFLADPNDPSNLVFFYPGAAMQLGTEGFAIGFLYTIVGLLLAFMTHALVTVKNVAAQRLIMVGSLVVSFWAVNKVIYLDNWKTGYGVHAFWPSSWK